MTVLDQSDKRISIYVMTVVIINNYHLTVETERQQLELRIPEIKKQKKQKFSDEVHDYREMDALAMSKLFVFVLK